VRLLGSGAILREVIAASELLATEWQVDSEVFSVTSFSELAREARDHRRAAIAEMWRTAMRGAASKAMRR
jgi:pyruvate dehydrogenase E1 component